MNKIEVVRDEQGFWGHPDLPDLDEGQEEEYRQWLADQGLVTIFAMLECEDDTNPVYISYFEDGDGDFSAWEPVPPSGDGWFTISIHDTEDGPIWVWARYEKIEPEELTCITCNGSGEGMHDGTTCRDCKGKGVEKGENQDES